MRDFKLYPGESAGCNNEAKEYTLFGYIMKVSFLDSFGHDMPGGRQEALLQIVRSISSAKDLSNCQASQTAYDSHDLQKSV